MKDIIAILVIYIFLGLLWQGLELFIDGYIQPSIVDTIVGAIFAVSIWLNFKLLKES